MLKALELRIPPGVVLVAAALLMQLLAWALPDLRVDLPGRWLLAGALALAGVVIVTAGVVAIRRARTTVNPMKPEKACALVQAGIYAHTRNPMYLGMLLLLAAFGIVLANPVALLLLPGYALYLHRFQIRPEERALTAKFGAAYEAYRSRVRRWV